MHLSTQVNWRWTALLKPYLWCSFSSIILPTCNMVIFYIEISVGSENYTRNIYFRYLIFQNLRITYAHTNNRFSFWKVQSCDQSKYAQVLQGKVCVSLQSYSNKSIYLFACSFAYLTGRVFTPQISATDRTGTGWEPGSGNLSRHPSWMARAWVLVPSLTVFAGASVSNWVRRLSIHV